MGIILPQRKQRRLSQDVQDIEKYVYYFVPTKAVGSAVYRKSCFDYFDIFMKYWNFFFEKSTCHLYIDMKRFFMYVVMVIGFINVVLYFKKGLLLFLQTSLRFESIFFFLEKSIFLSCKDGELFCFMTFFNQVT